MSHQPDMFGALVESAAGKEAFLCSVEQPKAGYVSLHFRIVIPITSDAPVAPPEHTNPLSFVEEDRTIGHTLKLYACGQRGVDFRELVHSTLSREYGAGARVEVKPVDAPKLVESLFHLPEVPIEL